MEFAAKFNRLDAAVQLQQETAQLEFRAVEEKWVNSKTPGELCFIGATVAGGQLQQRSACPNNVAYLVTVPAWRTMGEVAPVDGYQKMAQAA